jgi:hypothetical protein
MLMMYTIPAAQLVSGTGVTPPPGDPIVGPIDDDDTQNQDLAQSLVDRTRQDIEQDAEQEQEIDQEIEQENEANIDQSEVNNQANTIETGDNTASTTQVGENVANENTLEAGSEGGSAEAYKSDKSTVSGGDSSAEAALEQDVDNVATTTQTSSADDNVQVNENTFGNDVAVVDQDNTADQTAANIGIQTQDQDINQYATNADTTAQLGAEDQELCDPDAIGLTNIFEGTVGPIC